MHTRTLSLAGAAVVMLVAGPGCGLAPSGGYLGEPTTSNVTEESGYPCDVRAALQANCAPCHAGDRYVVPFNARESWLGRRGDGLTVGQYAAMLVATGMMPPANALPQPTDAERAVLIEWVVAGMPPGPCGPLTPPN
jgi:hypothetical protein